MAAQPNLPQMEAPVLDMNYTFPAEMYQLQARICASFSDATRIRIMDTLRQGERSVGEIVQETGVQQANVSQHLAYLRARGLVRSRREGTTIYYSGADPRVFQAMDLMREVLRELLKQGALLVPGQQ
jgi:DNA-binding transcriptional ArsR family regulator